MALLEPPDAIDPVDEYDQGLDDQNQNAIGDELVDGGDDDEVSDQQFEGDLQDAHIGESPHPLVGNQRCGVRHLSDAQDGRKGR